MTDAASVPTRPSTSQPNPATLEAAIAAASHGIIVSIPSAPTGYQLWPTLLSASHLLKTHNNNDGISTINHHASTALLIRNLQINSVNQPSYRHVTADT
ncbi:MAG: hypothetical protein ABJZ55_10530 [Fuerstiella sp.]